MFLNSISGNVLLLFSVILTLKLVTINVGNVRLVLRRRMKNFTQHSLDHIQDTLSSFGALGQERCKQTRASSVKSHQDGQGTGASAPGGAAGGPGLVHPERKASRGDPMAAPMPRKKLLGRCHQAP